MWIEGIWSGVVSLVRSIDAFAALARLADVAARILDVHHYMSHSSTSTRLDMAIPCRDEEPTEEVLCACIETIAVSVLASAACVTCPVQRASAR